MGRDFVINCSVGEGGGLIVSSLDRGRRELFAKSKTGPKTKEEGGIWQQFGI